MSHNLAIVMSKVFLSSNIFFFSQVQHKIEFGMVTEATTHDEKINPFG